MTMTPEKLLFNIIRLNNPDIDNEWWIKKNKLLIQKGINMIAESQKEWEQKGYNQGFHDAELINT